MSVDRSHLRLRRAGRGKVDVLQGAGSVIARRGAEGTRFVDVANETGSAISTLQYSFGSRDDLIMAALDEAARTDLARVRAACEAAADPVAQLRALAAAAVGVDGEDGARDAWLVWVEYWRAAARDSELREGSAAIYAGWRSLVTAILEHGREQGVFTESFDIDHATTQVLALIDGVGVPLVLKHPETTTATATDAVLSALAAILGCPALAAGARE
jgi:AcrR family transcriptional regulator